MGAVSKEDFHKNLIREIAAQGSRGLIDAHRLMKTRPGRKQCLAGRGSRAPGAVVDAPALQNGKPVPEIQYPVPKTSDTRRGWQLKLPLCRVLRCLRLGAYAFLRILIEQEFIKANQAQNFPRMGCWIRHAKTAAGFGCGSIKRDERGKAC